MDPFAVSHFSNVALLQDAKALVALGRKTSAMLLSRLIEIEDRKLHLRSGHPSMHAFCVRELHLSDGAAYKYINAARAARRFPAILVEVYEGRLHLRAVLMLAPHLPHGNAGELMAAAAHKTAEEIQLLLAQRFPRPDVPERLQSIPLPPPQPPIPAQWPAGPGRELAPGQAFVTTPEQLPRKPTSEERVDQPVSRSRLAPLAPDRFELRLTVDGETQDLLQRARAFLSHQLPTREIAAVLKNVLRFFVSHFEQRRYAATGRPRAPQRASTSSRHVPASVKRAVRERDGDQCAFASEEGRRCSSRTRLEFDHIEPLSRGAVSTVENLRLVCRAHNQWAAECAFGPSSWSGSSWRKSATGAATRRRAPTLFGPPTAAGCRASCAAGSGACCAASRVRR